MTTTYMHLSKDDFTLISRSLNILLKEGRLKNYDGECAEYIVETIRRKILFCGTTRQNWQVVDWNDPSFKDTSGRKKYDHYGDFE